MVDGAEDSQVTSRHLAAGVRVRELPCNVLEHHVDPAELPQGLQVADFELTVRELVGTVDPHVDAAQVGIVQDVDRVLMVAVAAHCLGGHEDVGMQLFAGLPGGWAEPAGHKGETGPLGKARSQGYARPAVPAGPQGRPGPKGRPCCRGVGPKGMPSSKGMQGLGALPGPRKDRAPRECMAAS